MCRRQGPGARNSCSATCPWPRCPSPTSSPRPPLQASTASRCSGGRIGGPTHRDGLSDRDMRRILDDHDLVITDVEAAGDWLGPPPEDQPAFLHHVYPTETYLDVAAALGCAHGRRRAFRGARSARPDRRTLRRVVRRRRRAGAAGCARVSALRHHRRCGDGVGRRAFGGPTERWHPGRPLASPPGRQRRRGAGGDRRQPGVFGAALRRRRRPDRSTARGRDAPMPAG